MSGIFGIIDSKQQGGSAAVAGKMAKVMSHHDWVVADHYTDVKLDLAIGRIGIGIFNKEPQPIWNASRSAAVVMAGEIYNRDELEVNDPLLSDEQLVLALYERYGDRFACRLEGAFIIGIWDEERRSLLLVNDRFGLYPTYIAQVGSRFLFAPELKGILVDSGINRSLRNDSVAEYFRFQRLLGSKTFFEGVNLLPPASCLTYQYGETSYRVCPYWDVGDLAPMPQSITFNEAVQEGARLLRASVRKMTRGTDRIGIFLSGGLDGRTILGMMPPEKKEIHTFTFGLSGCRDEYYASKIASAAGTHHHFYPNDDGCWIRELADWHMELTEGFQPWLHMHGNNILPMVRQNIDVNLSGLGDLLWTQQNFVPRYLVGAPDDIAFNSLFFELYSQKYSWPSITYAEERYLYHKDFYPHVRDLAFDSFVNELKTFGHLPYAQRIAAFNSVNHFSKHLLYSGVSGRSHIEYRFPYFDLDLLAFSYGLPYEMGLDRRLQVAIIEQEMPKLARIPNGNDMLPVSRSKAKRASAYFMNVMKWLINKAIPIFPSRPIPYADYETWLRTDLRQWAEGILFDKRTLNRGIFEPAALRSLFDRNLTNQQEWLIGKIAPLITFEMMLRRYAD